MKDSILKGNMENSVFYGIQEDKLRKQNSRRELSYILQDSGFMSVHKLNKYGVFIAQTDNNEFELIDFSGIGLFIKIINGDDTSNFDKMIEKEDGLFVVVGMRKYKIR